MQHDPAPSGLSYPFAMPPAPGEVTEVAPGVLWFRLKLPFALNHVNIYLIEDDDGWMVLDTGLATEDGRNGWDAVMNGPLKGQRLTAMVVTHFHPDHVGLAGWLSEKYGLQLRMPRTEYLYHLQARQPERGVREESHRGFYRKHGLSPDVTDLVMTRGHGYLRRTTMAPPTFDRIRHGDRCTIGGRTFDILTGGGHAVEQAMLYRKQDRLFFSADQVIAKISPNVSVHPMEPHEDELGTYLTDLRALRAAVGPDVLVLPGHGLPFHGLHERIDELIFHHGERCGLIAEASRKQPLTVAEMLPHVFDRALDPHQMGFAFGEVMAHVNYMMGRGELRQEVDSDGTVRFRA
jgi:glyoxylase-like metal-dependent hydrolase (beta-lactamase superfamily II)